MFLTNVNFRRDLISKSNDIHLFLHTGVQKYINDFVACIFITTSMKVKQIRFFNRWYFLLQTSGKLEKAEILEMTVDYLRAIQATEIGLRFENSEYSKWRASVRRRVAVTCTYVRSRVDHVPVIIPGYDKHEPEWEAESYYEIKSIILSLSYSKSVFPVIFCTFKERVLTNNIVFFLFCRWMVFFGHLGRFHASLSSGLQWLHPGNPALYDRRRGFNGDGRQMCPPGVVPTDPFPAGIFRGGGSGVQGLATAASSDHTIQARHDLSGKLYCTSCGISIVLFSRCSPILALYLPENNFQYFNSGNVLFRGVSGPFTGLFHK